MNFELTEEQKQLQKSVRQFAESEVKPLAKQLDETGHFPHETFRKAAYLGLTGVTIPESEGGSGFDHVAYTIVIEEIARCCASTSVILAGQNSLYCDPIHRLGSEEQKRRFLQPFARGEKIGCFALTEPQAGSNAAALQTVAVRRSDTYVLNGTKTWITNGSGGERGRQRPNLASETTFPVTAILFLKSPNHTSPAISSGSTARHLPEKVLVRCLPRYFECRFLCIIRFTCSWKVAL